MEKYPIINYLMEKLDMRNNLTEEETIMFFVNISNYLKHSKTGEIKGRTLNTVSQHIDELVGFLEKINCTTNEIITIISNSPDLLNIGIGKVINKYLILGCIKDCEVDEDYRKKKIIKHPQDFRVSIETVYARYKFAISIGYPSEKINWSMLVHDTNREFSKKFVKTDYAKPYKIYEDKTEFNMEKIKEKFYFTQDCIEEFKELECNRSLIEKLEKETFKM